jgi:hypothetical protein
MKTKTFVYGLILAVMIFSPLLSGCGKSIQEPEPTAIPTQEPEPTATPTQEPEPTATPTQEPEPTVTPTQESDQWISVTSLPEAFSSGVIRCSDDPDSFYLASGVVGDFVTTNRTYRYDIMTATWHRLADMPAPRRFSAFTCYEGKIYIAGGWDMIMMDAFFIYDLQTDQWSQGNPIPEPVWGAKMGAWDGKLYLVGGDRGAYDFVPDKKVDVYDIATQTWTAGGGADMPTASGFYAHVQTGPYLYAVGGFSGDFNNNINLTQRYDMSTNTWELGPTFTSARAYGQLVATSTQLYFAGGDLNGGEFTDMTNKMEVLDLSAWPEGEWTDLGHSLPSKTLNFASICTEILTGGEIWMVGGTHTGNSWYLSKKVFYLPIDDTCPDE